MEPLAAEWGIPVHEYWQLTFRELLLQVSANRKRQEYELKQKAMLDYKLAQLNAFGMNDPKEMPKAEDMYPFLAKEEEQIPVSEKPYDAETDKAIFQMMSQAVQNHLRKNGGEDNGD